MIEQFVNGVALGCGFAVGGALLRLAARELGFALDWFVGKDDSGR